MPHHRLGSKITVYSPFQCPVGLCLPLVLAQMFCPGIHQEYFQTAIRNFTIPKDPPPIGAITTSHATVLMHCFYKFCCPLRNDRYSIVTRTGPCSRSVPTSSTMTGMRQWFQGLRSAVESGSFAKSATARLAIVPIPA